MLFKLLIFLMFQAFCVSLVPEMHNIGSKNIMQDVKDGGFFLQSSILNMDQSKLFSELSKPCQKFLNDAFNELQRKYNYPKVKLQTNVKSMLDFSGQWPGKLGKYKNCNEVENMEYYFGEYLLTQEGNDDKVPARSSMCLPKVCNPTDVNILFKFKSSKDLNLCPLPGFEVNFYDFEKIKDSTNKPKTVGFWIFFAYIGQFFTIATASTIYNKLNMLKEIFKTDDFLTKIFCPKKTLKVNQPPQPLQRLDNTESRLSQTQNDINNKLGLITPANNLSQTQDDINNNLGLIIQENKFVQPHNGGSNNLGLIIDNNQTPLFNHNQEERKLLDSRQLPTQAGQLRNDVGQQPAPGTLPNPMLGNKLIQPQNVTTNHLGLIFEERNFIDTGNNSSDDDDFVARSDDDDLFIDNNQIFKPSIKKKSNQPLLQSYVQEENNMMNSIQFPMQANQFRTDKEDKKHQRRKSIKKSIEHNRRITNNEVSKNQFPLQQGLINNNDRQEEGGNIDQKNNQQQENLVETGLKDVLASKKTEIKKSTLLQAKIVASFDVIDRFKSLVVCKRSNPESAAFDLVRVISFSWVVLGHSFLQHMVNISEVMNLPMWLETIKYNGSMTLISLGPYAVDFFFFMGGYVAIISLNRTVTDFKNCKWWTWPILYIFLLIKRYMRLLPMLVPVVLFAGEVFFFTTPATPTNDKIIKMDPNGISWKDFNLFFIKVPYLAEINCGWLWYLVVDFQCFLVVPIMLMLNFCYRRAGLILCTCQIIYSSLYTYIRYAVLGTDYAKNHQMIIIYGLAIDMGYNEEYYFNWNHRCSMYFIGSAIAFLTLKGPKPKPKTSTKTSIKPNNDLQNNTIVPNQQVTLLGEENKPQKTGHPELGGNSISQPKPSEKTKEKRKKKAKLMIYLIAFVCLILALMVCLVQILWFQPGHDPWNYGPFANATFAVFGKIFFVASIMVLLIIICRVNRALPDMIANNAIIQLIANLSFSMYLWHYIILYVLGANSQTNGYMVFYEFYGMFVWVFLAAFICALVTSTAIEFPCGDLWKLIEVPFLTKLKSYKKKKFLAQDNLN